MRASIAVAKCDSVGTSAATSGAMPIADAAVDAYCMNVADAPGASVSGVTNPQ